MTYLSPFHTGDQIGTTIEVRPYDCIDLNGAYHTWSWSDIWWYNKYFGHMILRFELEEDNQFGRTTSCRLCEMALKNAFAYELI